MDARHPSRLDSALWAAQVTLFAAFGAAGIAKALVPAAVLQARLHLFPAVPGAVLPLAGLVEIAAAFAVLVPAAARVAPGLSSLAAAFLACLSLLGAALPASGALVARSLPSLALAGLAAFAAWGRTARLPLHPGWTRDERAEVERRFREVAPPRAGPGVRSVG